MGFLFPTSLVGFLFSLSTAAQEPNNRTERNTPIITRSSLLHSFSLPPDHISSCHHVSILSHIVAADDDEDDDYDEDGDDDDAHDADDDADDEDDDYDVDDNDDDDVFDDTYIR